MVAGEPLVLLEMVTVPLELPGTDGLNTTLKFRLCAGVSAMGALTPFRLKLVPLGVICKICTLAFPVLVTVTDFEKEPPSVTVPKLKFVGLIDNVCVAEIPVPDT